MKVRRARLDASRPLHALGISLEEERVYRALLVRRAASAADIARDLGWGARRTQRLLDAIEAKGLASRSGERPRRYASSPPQFAIEALIAQGQTDLARARATIDELRRHTDDAAQDASEDDQRVELVADPAAARQILAQLMQSMHAETVMLQCAPVMFSKLDEDDGAETRVLADAVARGARVRSVSDAGLLALPGALTRLRRGIDAGEEARVFPALPFKLAVFDRRVALVPLDNAAETGRLLLVREPKLLDALSALFESFWQRATPIAFTRAGALQKIETPALPDEVTERVIPLLAAGLNDKSVAHKLGISIATLNRRIAALMKSMDSRTRFQMGWRAATETFAAANAPVADERRSARSR
jgi:sugar-specific transcriptional regulator TrmB